MAKCVPKIKLSNGREIPQMGLGTAKAGSLEILQAVKNAIDIGYRHFDCALVYGNESEVGEGIWDKIDEGVVTREEVFITSKIWNTYHSKERVIDGVKETLANLQMNYIDLCLIHWPMGFQEGGFDVYPRNAANKVIYSDVDYVETWKGLEECYRRGMVRSIGLSNFNSHQIQRVWNSAQIKPVMLQVESHPYLNQRKLVDFCKQKNMAVTAFSCLGSPARVFAADHEPVVMEDPVINEIARQVKRTPAQVCLRYQIERGVVVIPKTVTRSRLQTNFNLFDFSLTPKQIKAIDSVDINLRLIHQNWFKDHPHYPFHILF